MTAIEWRLDGKRVFDPKTLREQLPEESAVLSQCNRFIDNRAYQPSVGHLLMVRKEIVELSKRQEFGLTLEVSDGGRKFRRRKLAIVETEAVWPNAVNGKTTETTPYVVKVADARYFARMSYVNQSFNRLLGDSEFSSDRRSAHQIIKELWKGLQSVFGFDITIRTKDAALEDLAFHGVNAWDALWHVLNFMGWSFRMTEEGRPEIFQLEQEDDSLRGGVELDGTYWLLKPVVPKTVVACCQKRDYQWQRKTGQETAGDAHRIDPVYQLKIDTEAFLEAPVGDDDEPQESAIAAHRIGEEPLWVPTTMLVGSNGPVNESRVRRVLREYSKRWFLAQTMLNRVTGYRFAGLYLKRINSRWGAIVYGDTGEGLTTLVLSTSVDTERARTPVSDFRPGPPNALDWAPYGREAWVKITGPVNPSGDNENSVGPNQAALVQLRSGQLSQGEILWNEAKSATAYNSTGKTIKAGQVGYAKWNYQIGDRGVWCIVSVSSEEGGQGNGTLDLPDWSSACFTGEESSVEGYNDPTSVVVNRASMLRLLSLSGRRMGVEIRRGPNDTVLNTSQDGKIYWADSPRSRNVWLSGAVWFGGDRFPHSSITTGGSHVQMPETPTQSHKYVIAKRRGPGTVDLGWHGPGMDVNIHVPKCRTPQEEKDWFNYLLYTELLPYLCDYMKRCDLYDSAYGEEGGSPGDEPDPLLFDSYEGYGDEEGLQSSNPNCEEWTFSNGLLVKVPGGKFPSPRTVPARSFSPAFNFNPCGSTKSGESGPTSPGDPDNPDGGGDDNPVLPDDEDGIQGDLGGGVVGGEIICGPIEQPIPCSLYDPWGDPITNLPDLPDPPEDIGPRSNDPWRSS